MAINRIRHIRESKGMTQFDLVLASRIPQGVLSMLERDRLKPWPKVTDKLCAALGVTAEELFPDEACDA